VLDITKHPLSPRFPLDVAVREHLRCRAQRAVAAAAGQDLSRQKLEDLAIAILREEGLSDAYRSWLMVILANRFWQPQMAAVPFHRRLLLLAGSATGRQPGLLVGDGLEAEVGPEGRNGDPDGSLAWTVRWRDFARTLGYQVLATDRVEEVGHAVRARNIEAVVGIADLAGLEKAIDQVLSWGLPCMAEPLLRDPNEHHCLDEAWVERMLELPYDPTQTAADHYGHLMRAARELFTLDSLNLLMPTSEYRRLPAPMLASAGTVAGGATRLARPLPVGSAAALEPLAGTATIAYDFLTRGGKYSRPFITMAVYDAMTGEAATKPAGNEAIATWSRGIKRTAMSIEVFHKASLIHDDIEDHDDFRYGEPAVHKRFGVATAINVGDFLVGMGYRLVSGCATELGGQMVADLLDCLAAAHQRLSEGQGAELLWRDSDNKGLTPEEALQIYALKTAPAFEVAFYSGLRLAGPVTDLRPVVEEFCDCVGVAFQILNDLQDWCEDAHNKVAAGGDVLGGRPTLLWALALQQAAPDQRQELLRLMHRPDSPADPESDRARIESIRRLYQALGVFQQAVAMVEDLEQRARGLAATVVPASLSRLMQYLVGSVLQRMGLNKVLQ
jgi:geranylgeranyl diphosphate synthase, type II